MKDILATKDARLEELEAKVTQLETLELKFEELEAENQKQEEKIVALQKQMDERPSNSILSQFAIHPSGDSNTPVAAAAMPKSCADLRSLGHSSNGLYLIMGTEKVETVFCDFAAALPSDPSNKINFNITFPILPIETSLNQLNKCRCCVLQVFRRGSDTSTSNRRPFISTFRDMKISTKQIRRFYLTWKN